MNKTTPPNETITLQTVSSADFASVKQHPILLRQVILGIQANLHRPTADTKTRGQVSGGGRKPWRQKGTGRARVGSSRVPLWRGGGITFGPSKARNFSHVLPIKFKQQAMQTILAQKAESGRLHVADVKNIPSTTKEALIALPQILELQKVLLVVPDRAYVKAFRNIEHVWVMTPSQISVLTVANAGNVIFIGETYDQFKAKFVK